MPCETSNAQYEVWAHYLLTRRAARLARLTLPQPPAQLQRQLDPPAVADPWALLGLAERGSEAQQHRLRSLGIPATTSLVRICHDAFHLDGPTTNAGSGRLEAAARILWLPPAAGRVAVQARLTEVDDEGVGTAQASNGYFGRLTPVVSVPLTPAEQQRFERAEVAEVSEAWPSQRRDKVIYAVIHPDEVGQPLERLFTVDLPPPPA